MKFTLEIELGTVVNTPIDVAELLNRLRHDLRENGFRDGAQEISTLPRWRQSQDAESTELVTHTVGWWEVTE